MFNISILEAQNNNEEDNITNFNIAMSEASQGHILKSLIFLEGIKTNNKTLFFKKKYYINLLLFIKYNRKNNYSASNKKSLDEIIEYGIKNEEILIIYIKTLNELYLVDKDIKTLNKYMKPVSKFNHSNLKNESKLILTSLYIYKKEYKKAISIYENVINPNYKYLSVLNILNKKYIDALSLINNSKEDSLENEWIKLFLNLKLKNKTEILKITTRSDINEIFKFKEKYPFSLGVNEQVFNFKFAKKQLLNYKNKYNSIFIDFLFYHLDLKINDSLSKNYISSEDIFNGINKEKFIDKLNKIKSYKILLRIEKMNPYDKIKTYKKYIDNIQEPDSYDLYNLGILYGQVKDYETSYEYLYRSFFKNPELNISGVLITLLNKYKINALTKHTDIKLISKIIHNSDNKVSKYLFDYFQNKTSLIITDIPENRTEEFVFNFINYLETTDIKYLENIKNLNNLTRIMYILYKNIHNSTYSFSSYIQDNLNVKQLLYHKEPFIVGELNLLFLQSTNNISLVKEFKMNNSIKSSYLRNYAILQTINKNYSEADSIFSYLSNNYKINDLNTFLFNLICKIKLNKENEKLVLIEKGANIFKTNEMNLIKSLLYMNTENIEIFNILISKEFSEKIIEINIDNISNILTD
jgi:hypothetical protein